MGEVRPKLKFRWGWYYICEKRSASRSERKRLSFHTEDFQFQHHASLRVLVGLFRPLCFFLLLLIYAPFSLGYNKLH